MHSVVVTLGTQELLPPSAAVNGTIRNGQGEIQCHPVCILVTQVTLVIQVTLVTLVPHDTLIQVIHTIQVTLVTQVILVTLVTQAISHLSHLT